MVVVREAARSVWYECVGDGKLVKKMRTEFGGGESNGKVTRQRHKADMIKQTTKGNTGKWNDDDYWTKCAAEIRDYAKTLQDVRILIPPMAPSRRIWRSWCQSQVGVWPPSVGSGSRCDLEPCRVTGRIFNGRPEMMHGNVRRNKRRDIWIEWCRR